MEAASTADAWPSRMPSTRCSSRPTPPDAITGTRTASATARVRGRSKPRLVPSRSMEVSRISPAPWPVMCRAHSTASMPVASRPPWVKTSKRPDAVVLASTETTMHWEPNLSCRLGDEFGPLHGGCVDGDLVGTRQQQTADVAGGPHAAADGERHEAGLGGAPHRVEEDAPVLVAGGDVEEGQLVGAFPVVDPGLLDGIAGVHQVDEVDALDHPAPVHVQTRDDARLQHGSASRSIAAASAASTRPS